MKNSLTQNLSMITGIKQFLFLAILLLGSQAAFAQANDLCANAEAIACGDVVNATTVGATSDATIPFCGTTLTTAPGIWYTFVGTGDDIVASLCGTAFDTKLGVFTGACDALVCEGGDDDEPSCSPSTLASQVPFSSVAGTTYFIYVTGFNTNAGDFTLSLTCTAPPPPIANNLCADAEAIACGDVVNATTVGATSDATIPFCGTTLTTAPGIWYTFVGTGDDIVASLCGTAFDTKLGVFTGACDALVCEGGDDDEPSCSPSTLASQVPFSSVAGTTYFIYVTGFNTNAGDFTLSLTCTAPPLPPANDLCADAIAITGAGAIDGTNVAGTTTAAPPACGNSGTLSSSAGVWYSYVGDGSVVTVDLCGSSDDTKVGVFSGACDALTCVDGEDDDFTVCGGNDPSVTFTAEMGTNYFIYVTSFGTDSEEPFTLNVAVVAPPVAVCQTAVVMLDADGMGSVIVGDVDGGSTADAGIASIALTGTTNFTCAEAGTTQTVTLTVTDNNGAMASCDAMVMIMDVMPPMAMADDITINILPDEVIEVDAAALGLDASDNCGVASIVISPNTFTQANEGANIVTITVTDANGMPVVIMVTVFVNSFTPLDMVCRQPVSTCNVIGQCGRGDLIILEPYVPDNMNLVSLTNDAPDFFPVGTTDIIWSATSVDGLVSQCISQVIIYDEEAPVINCPGNIVKFLEPNLCTSSFNLSVTATDNCGIASVTGTGFQNLPVGLYPTEIIVTDFAGNATTCIATIAVHDSTSPELVSCPGDVNVTAPTGATEVFVNLPQPVITDACGVDLENDAPALFPIGTTTVNWKGNDSYGNWVMCTYDVIVTTAGTVMGAMAPIEASLADENARVNWNAPNILSYCEECADTDMANYQYLGDYYGHQYFLYTLDAVSLEQAQTLAAAMGGSVVTINTAGENDFLRGQLAGTGQNILVQTAEYDNFPADVIPIEFPETVVMNNDGYWNFANTANTYYFVSEKACVDITQTGPYAEMPNIYGEMETTLLTPGGEWPAGEYVVTYELTDACGASQTHGFDVTVDEAVANYCTTGNMAATTDVENVWIENVVMDNFVNASTQADAGYADYSDLEGLKFIVEEGQTPMTTVKLTPGGNTAGELLYWTVWADTNADGDFFDTEALLQISGVGTVAAEMIIPVAEVSGTKLRVMVSRYAYCQPCGNVLVGEAEDYRVTISNTAVANTRFGEDDTLVKLTTSAYPNPVSDVATLALGDLPAGYVTVTLMDNLGRTLEVRDYEGMGNERLQFNVSNYASGLLIFKLTQDGEVVGTQRIVKK